MPSRYCPFSLPSSLFFLKNPPLLIGAQFNLADEVLAFKLFPSADDAARDLVYVRKDTPQSISHTIDSSEQTEYFGTPIEEDDLETFSQTIEMSCLTGRNLLGEEAVHWAWGSPFFFYQSKDGLSNFEQLLF